MAQVGIGWQALITGVRRQAQVLRWARWEQVLPDLRWWQVLRDRRWEQVLRRARWAQIVRDVRAQVLGQVRWPQVLREVRWPQVLREARWPQALREARWAQAVRSARWARGVRWALVSFVVGSLLCLGWLTAQTIAFARAYSGRILPGAMISGVDVSGMTQPQALEAVRAVVEPRLDRTIKLVHLDRTWETTPRKLGAGTDAEAVVGDAAAKSDAAGWDDLFGMRWLNQGLGFQRSVAVVPDEPVARALVDQIAAERNVPVRDASINYSTGWVEFTREQVGRAVATQATSAELLAAQSNGQDVVTVQSLEFQPSVTMATFHKVLLLRQDQHRLYLYENGQRTREWLVATGTGGYPTPKGEYRVAAKRYLPTWVNPDPEGWGKGMPAEIGPGPNNPLGLRALNWTADGIRFHGTSNVASLGQNASHGCVRLSNHDAVQLYDLVNVGTKIISLG